MPSSDFPLFSHASFRQTEKIRLLYMAFHDISHVAFLLGLLSARVAAIGQVTMPKNPAELLAAGPAVPPRCASAPCGRWWWCRASAVICFCTRWTSRCDSVVGDAGSDDDACLRVAAEHLASLWYRYRRIRFEMHPESAHVLVKFGVPQYGRNSFMQRLRVRTRLRANVIMSVAAD